MRLRLPTIFAVAALCGLAAPTVASADYSSAVVNDRPLAYYHLNEASGPVAADSSNSIPAADGVYSGSGVGYGAAGGFPATGSGPAVNLTTGTVTATVMGVARTAELWVNPSSRTSQTLLRHGDPAADGWAIGIAPATAARGAKRKVYFQSGGVSVNLKTILVSGVWTMVAVTWDATHVTVNLNGGAVSRTLSTPTGWTAPGPAFDPTLQIGPGAGPGGTSVDEVAIFGEELTPSQIAAHYAATLLPKALTRPALSPLEGIRDGDALTLTAGTYDGASIVTEQWQRCDQDAACSPVAGAPGTSYTATHDDVDHNLQVQETATNANGSVSVFSDATDPILSLAPAITPTDPIMSLPPAITPTDPSATTTMPVQTAVGAIPISCATKRRLSATKARTVRMGEARVTLKLTPTTRRVSLRAQRGTVRSVTFKLNGKPAKAARKTPRILTIRQAWMKPGKHTLKVTVKPSRGHSRTITMRLVVNGC